MSAAHQKMAANKFGKTLTGIILCKRRVFDQFLKVFHPPRDEKCDIVSYSGVRSVGDDSVSDKCVDQTEATLSEDTRTVEVLSEYDCGLES